jgi:hypothetical protein
MRQQTLQVAESNTQSRQLALISQASQALAEARTLPDIKHVHDKAEAIRHFAKSASLGLEMQNAAAEIKLRAERKAGSALADLALRGGDRKSNSHGESLILDDLGVDRNQSSRWQQAAAVPEKDFQRYLEETKAANRELTAAGLARFAGRLPSAKVGGNGKTHAARANRSRNGATDRLEPTGEIAEIARELTNHVVVLRNILDPFCVSDATHLSRAERQHIPRVLADVARLLKDLASLE